MSVLRHLLLPLLPDWSLFLLDHPLPSEMVTSQWQADPGAVSAAYLAYRASACVFVVGVIAASLATLPYDKILFPIFLTHWGLCALALFEAVDLALLCVTSCRQRERRSSSSLSVSGGLLLRGGRFGPLHKLSWTLSNVACAAAPVITLFYWLRSVRFRPEREDQAATVDDTHSSLIILEHVINSVVVIVEILVTARPWRWHHFYQPAILGMLYTIFTVIYHVSGGKGKGGESYIYEMLDWRHPGWAVLVSGGATAFVVLAHLGNCGLCRLRGLLRAVLDHRRRRRRRTVAATVGSSTTLWPASGFKGETKEDLMALSVVNVK